MLNGILRAIGLRRSSPPWSRTFPKDVQLTSNYLILDGEKLPYFIDPLIYVDKPVGDEDDHKPRTLWVGIQLDPDGSDVVADVRIPVTETDGRRTFDGLPSARLPA